LAAKPCSVSFLDHRGIRHSVTVAAESVFEAAAAGLAEFRRNGWLEAQPGVATALEVRVHEPITKHTVTVQQLQRWAQSTAITPADRIKREKVKRLLLGTWK
jgi:hypothetical protein